MITCYLPDNGVAFVLPLEAAVAFAAFGGGGGFAFGSSRFIVQNCKVARRKRTNSTDAGTLVPLW